MLEILVPFGIAWLIASDTPQDKKRTEPAQPDNDGETTKEARNTADKVDRFIVKHIVPEIEHQQPQRRAALKQFRHDLRQYFTLLDAGQPLPGHLRSEGFKRRLNLLCNRIKKETDRLEQRASDKTP